MCHVSTRPYHVPCVDKTIPCAMCRQDTPVPNPTRPVEEWAKQLKPSLMDRHQKDHRQKTEKDLCFMCKEIEEATPASSWCSDCEVSLCNRCAKMHIKALATKKHDLFDLSEGSKVKERRKVKCKEHEGELITVICRDCNKAVCHICCIQKHNKHNVATIETMVPEIKSTLTEKRGILKRKMAENVANVQKEESKIQQIKDPKAKVGSEVKSAVNNVMALLKEKERKLLKDIDDASDRQTEVHQANVKSDQIATQMYQQHCEFIDQALQSESEVDMYDMYQVCLSGAVDSDVAKESDSKSRPVAGKVKFTSNMEALKNAITEFGEILIETEGTTDQQERKKPFAQSFEKPVLQDTFDLKHISDSCTPDPSDVTLQTIYDESTMIFADCGNNCIKAIPVEHKEEMSVLKLSDMPFAITNMTENRIAVMMLELYIVVATVIPNLAQIFNLKTRKKYKGITALSESTLAVAIGSTVDILDLKGNVLRSFPTQMLNPNYLCTTNEGNILMSIDSSLSCQTPDGKLDLMYTPTPERNESGMKGITVSYTGDIFLAYWRSKKVIQLTPDGKFVKNILTSADGIDGPWDVCVHRDKLYVCQRKLPMTCIKVFSL